MADAAEDNRDPAIQPATEEEGVPLAAVSSGVEESAYYYQDMDEDDDDDDAQRDAGVEDAKAELDIADDDDDPMKPKKAVTAKGDDLGDDVGIPGANVENVKILSKRIPVTFFRDKLAERVDARHLLRDFILHVPFVIAFIFFMFGRRSVSEEYLFTESVKNYLTRENLPPTNPANGEANGMPYFHKDYTEVGNYGDIYDWAESVLAPRMFSNAPEARLSRNRRFRGQNLLLGAVRIRTKHVRGDSCKVNPAWYPPNQTDFPRVCYGEMSMGNEQKEPFQPVAVQYNWTDDCNTYPLQFISGKYAFYDCAGFTFDIPFNETLSDALQLISSFRENQFARIESLRLFIVEFFTYNPAVNTYLSVKLIVEVTEGGGFMPWARVRPFVVFPGSAGWIVYNCFFLCLVLFYMYRFVVDWRRSIRVTKSKVQFLLSVWNLMQLANLIIFVPVYVLFFMWVYYSDKVETLYPDPSPDYPELLSAIAELYITQIYLNAVNTIFTFLVALKFAQLNQRLNILQRTVGRAVQPLLAVLIIFVIVVLSYALAGTLIFGTGVEAFRDVSTAFVSLFRVLVGDFDYWALWGENRALAFIYFWSFVVLGLFILLNFIVAIMMGAFSDENAKLKPKSIAILITETVERQRNTMIARMKKVFEVACSSKRMPEDTLLEMLNNYLEDYSKDTVAAEEEFEIESFDFGRYDLFKIIPRAELEDIGDEYLDSMWYGIVDDYNSAQEDDGDVEKEIASRQLYEFAKDAISEYFTDFRMKLFGDNDFLDQLLDRAEYFDEDTRREAQRQVASIREVASVPLRLDSGKVPRDTNEVLGELMNRAQRIERTTDVANRLMLDATRDRPAPTRRDVIPHALPPPPPGFSGIPVAGAQGELPDRADAMRRAARLRRQQFSMSVRAPSASQTDLLTMQERSIDDGPIVPRTQPNQEAVADRIILQVNGFGLPQGGDWMATDSDEYVWSRRKQCFLHLPTGHLASPDGKLWYVPGSNRSWMPAAERRTFLDRERAEERRREEQKRLESSRREVPAFLEVDETAADGLTQTDSAMALRWPKSIEDVPLPTQTVSSSAVQQNWRPTEYAFSPPAHGEWEPVSGCPGFFVYREGGLFFFAHAGHYFDPHSGLWYVPSASTWVSNTQHETVLAQLKSMGRF